MKGSIMTRMVPVFILMMGISGMAFAAGGSQPNSGVTTLSYFCVWNTGKQNDYDQAPYMKEYLAKELGVAIEIRTAGGISVDQYVNTMVASNDMTDIFSMRDPTMINNITGSGRLTDLAAQRSKLPSLFNNPHFSSALAYHTDRYGNGRSLYTIPVATGSQPNARQAVFARYDLYKRLGSPKINTLEDLLPVIKQMVDLYPVNEDGQKVFGIALFSEWDGGNMALARYPGTSFGWEMEGKIWQTYVDGTRPIIGILDDSGVYKRWVKFFYTANQMGLLDPDSITMKVDAYAARIKAGRAVFIPNDMFETNFNTLERRQAGIGFAPIEFGDQRIMVTGDNPVGYSNRVWAVPRSTKNLDAALRFINWSASYEGQDMWHNGPRGMIWDLDANGQRYVTEAGWALKNNNQFKTGNLLDDLINAGTINPNTGMKLGHNNWESSRRRGIGDNRLFQIWSEDHNNAISYADYYMDHTQTVKDIRTDTFMPAMPAELEDIKNQIADIVITASWRAVYARNDAEFNSIWQDAQNRSNGLGMQRVLEWANRSFNQAKLDVNKYKPAW